MNWFAKYFIPEKYISSNVHFYRNLLIWKSILCPDASASGVPCPKNNDVIKSVTKKWGNLNLIFPQQSQLDGTHAWYARDSGPSLVEVSIMRKPYRECKL